MSISKQKLIVVGNGMVATRFLENLSNQADCRYDISVFGGESHGGYNRILLSPLLSGEQTLDNIITHTSDWYKKNNIRFHKGKMIVNIDRDNNQATDHDGHVYSYDKLVMATGSNPFVPSIPGNKLKGVHTYRTINDVEMMLDICKTGTKAVVIGGGLLGLEAAYGLMIKGMEVTVLHLCSILMENQLDELASKKLINSLQAKGISIRTEANTKIIHGTKKVESVELSDGTVLPADLLVIAVGIRANTELAQSTGLKCGKGIVVNDHLQTSDKNIFALGECVEHRGVTYGLVAPLYEQADICAKYLSGNTKAKYSGSITATGLKVTGVHLFSAGQFLEDENCKVVRLTDDKKGIYRKLVIKNNKLVGALLYGDITGSLWYQQLIQAKEDVAAYKNVIMFGSDYVPRENTLQMEALAV